MPVAVPVFVPTDPVALYESNGVLVGSWVPETGRGMIGDCFVVKERTCQLKELDGIFFCSECNHMAHVLNKPNFCPHCGARVVS